MTLDWSVSVSDILAVLGACVTFIYFINKMGARLDIVEHDLSGMKDTLDKIADALRLTDRLLGRLDELDHRIDALSRRLDSHLSDTMHSDGHRS